MYLPNSPPIRPLETPPLTLVLHPPASGSAHWLCLPTQVCGSRPLDVGFDIANDDVKVELGVCG